MLVYSTTAIPFCVWTLKGYFDTLPRELEEAARIDGSARWDLLEDRAPALDARHRGDRLLVHDRVERVPHGLVFLTQPESFTLPIGVRLFVNQFTQNWGGTMALSVIVTIPVMLFFYFAQRYLISGLSTGGVKG